jgi:hypothetical protein
VPFSSRTRARPAAKTDYAPSASAVMMVTVPALTALESGNIQGAVSGVKTGSAARALSQSGQRHHATKDWRRQRRAQSSSDLPYISPLARPHSLRRVDHRREQLQPSWRFSRTEFLGPLVPETGHCDIGRAFLEAERLQHVRVERAGQR